MTPTNAVWAVRAAAAADIPAVLDVWRRGEAVPSVTDDVASVRRVLDARSQLLVAEVGPTVIGTLIAGWDGWRGTLSRLVVLPEHRRRGVASSLVAAAHRHLLAQGAVRVDALVVRDEQVARSFWARRGYEADERIVRYVTTLH